MKASRARAGSGTSAAGDVLSGLEAGRVTRPDATVIRLDVSSAHVSAATAGKAQIPRTRFTGAVWRLGARRAMSSDTSCACSSSCHRWTIARRIAPPDMAIESTDTSEECVKAALKYRSIGAEGVALARVHSIRRTRRPAYARMITLVSPHPRRKIPRFPGGSARPGSDASRRSPRAHGSSPHGSGRASHCTPRTSEAKAKRGAARLELSGFRRVVFVGRTTRGEGWATRRGRWCVFRATEICESSG